ncbi:CobW family GTP-binding protein [Rhodopila sp.]|uniref:CobW family GTP-binding protein n=1 Tax=Rhodopila sp. TaxID=2480087 RepID=UPI003D096FF6
MIPVSVVTGFLGSGKTTLIGRMLRDPAFGRTAVIVNEFGEIGLDHDLIASSDESVVELTTGCLCCAVQTDLARTLLALMDRRQCGDVGYDRVLIETSGLADPAPVLSMMMTDSQIAATHQMSSITTLVDTVHGEATLERHVEARRQVALADHLLLSKTDIAAVSQSLASRVMTLNPHASVSTTAQINAAFMFATGAIELVEQRLASLENRRANHAVEIETFVLTRDRPLPALALTLLLQALAEHCGIRLLRMKGLVAIEEMPGQPAVIHGVRHVVSSPVFLERWPGADTSTRIIFIADGIPRYFPSRLLEAIEAEVREQTAS